MRLRLTREEVVSWAFIILSVSSAVYVVAGAVNYLRFFPALARLHSEATRVALVSGTSSNDTKLSAHIIIDNPTDYSGFKVRDLTVRVYFVHPTTPSNISLFQGQPLVGSQSVGGALGPHSHIDSDVIISPSHKDSVALSDFNNTYFGQIFVRATLTVQINTFLDPVIGRVSVERMEELLLS